MADPLTIAAGVVSIVIPALHGTHVLIDDVKRIIDAPEAVQALRDDLGSTALALESLKAIPESEWQLLGSAVAEQSKDAVKTCGSACDHFRNDLQRWTRRSRDGELSWRDRANVSFLKQQQVKAMSEHLQSCKLTCSSVAGMRTLYTSLRTSHMTEELKNTIATSRNELSVVAKRNSDEIALVRQSLTKLSVKDTVAAHADDEDDRISTDAQLSQQKAALKICQGLFSQLQSMLRDEQIEKLAAGRGGNANVSFGTIIGGFGIGVSNAPIAPSASFPHD
ncbi:hypothetical protein LTR28_005075 [Elasticomyces elasticus]|nr:hypothetical protein LTR28_005075 [Elasticomyces elasticus]